MRKYELLTGIISDELYSADTIEIYGKKLIERHLVRQGEQLWSEELYLQENGNLLLYRIIYSHRKVNYLLIESPFFSLEQTDRVWEIPRIPKMKNLLQGATIGSIIFIALIAAMTFSLGISRKGNFLWLAILAMVTGLIMIIILEGIKKYYE